MILPASRLGAVLSLALAAAASSPSAGGIGTSVAAGAPAGRIRRVLRPAFKPLRRDSVLMLIGDLPPPGPGGWLKTLKDRIDVAAANSVDTVVLVCDTRHVESGFDTLDALVRLAGERGLGVMPRLVVDSAAFTERVPVTQLFAEQLPAYANQAQLAGALDLLTSVINHLETFPNIVAYQVEWGHFGESWINAPFWDSPSSVAAFLDYLHDLSPEFAGFSAANVAGWSFGGVMAAGGCWPPADPRLDATTVAEFHWYQRWRYETTRAITWALRAWAQTLTGKPIAGFSYVVGGPDGVIGHAYTAGQNLDAAYCDWTPTPGTAHQDFIRDAGFAGLHLVELDFDTPYYELERAAEAIANLAGRGIVPVIFYPHWSSALADADIPALVAQVRANPPLADPEESTVLVVLGNQAIGVTSLTGIGVLADAGATVTSNDPPGIIALLLGRGISVDVVSPDAYVATLGNRYQAVVVASPLAASDSALPQELAVTGAPVLIAHPSFVIGGPAAAKPAVTTSAYCSQWNPASLAGQPLGVQVWGIEETPGPPPDIRFVGTLAGLGTITGYLPNRRVFSFYQAGFDEVLAIADFPAASFPVIGRIGSAYTFGLMINVADPSQRAACQAALLAVLARMGVSLPPAPTP
jgi:hypothetical protein